MIDDPVSPTRPTLGFLLTSLVGQIQTLIRAQLRVYQAEAAWRTASVGWAAGFAFVALALTQALLVALLVGLIMALTPLWGIGWAIGTVMLGGLVMTGLLGWLAYRRIGTALSARASHGNALERTSL